MRSIRVVMKSGYSFSFPCDEFKTKTANGELLAYSYDGARIRWPMFIRIADVDVIIDEGDTEEDKRWIETTLKK